MGEVQNGAQTTPVAGAEPREVMPLVSYRGSEEAVLHEIHEVTGRRQSAKQVLSLSKALPESTRWMSAPETEQAALGPSPTSFLKRAVRPCFSLPA